MEIFKLTTGILIAKVRYTALHVIVTLKFEGQPEKYEIINKGNFENLKSYIKTEFTVID